MLCHAHNLYHSPTPWQIKNNVCILTTEEVKKLNKDDKATRVRREIIRELLEEGRSIKEIITILRALAFEI